MNLDAFAGLPDHARLYLFGASRRLSPADQDRIRVDLDQFVGVWKAHGAPVAGAWALEYDRFLMVAVDEDQTALSGCSIDSLTRIIKTLESELGLSLFDGGMVLFRDGDDIRKLSRADFSRLASDGAITADTVVFDNTLQSLRPLREGKWEVPAGQAWHSRAFSLGAPVAKEAP